MDKSRTKLKNIYKAFGAFTLYFFYQINFFIMLFGINIKKLSSTAKTTVLILDSLIYLILIFLIYKKDIISSFKKLKKNIMKNLLLSTKCWFVGCLIMAITSYIISFIINKDLSSNEEALNVAIKAAPIFMTFSCSIVAPILEEMIFRKSLSILIKPKWLFILSSGFIFGLLHVVGATNSIYEYLYIIPYGAMGSCFAYLYTKTDNIMLPILVHMCHNTILTIVKFI